jgi:intracellular septation protein A
MFAQFGSAIGFILKNFATPVVFYVAFKFGGPKEAIAFAVGVALIQVAAHLAFRWSFSPYFLLSSVFTMVFGGADLFVKTPRFFRLEPFAQNMTIALLFMGSLWTRRALVEILAESLPISFRPVFHRDDLGYLRKLTWIWAGYFVLKAFFFLYLAFRIDLGSLYVSRVVFGNLSAVLLLLGEIIYRKKIRHRGHRPLTIDV